MSEPVKRSYSSQLRDAQARATRRAVVDAAAALFIERGYGPTTVDAIAERAGVSRKTVFTAVGSKAQALKLAIDWAIVGDDEPIPMLERPHVKAGQRQPDPRRILSDYAHTIRDVGGRLAPLHTVLQAAAGLDPELRALAEENRRQRQVGMVVIAELLSARRALREDLTVEEAADILWLFNDPSVYHRLVTEQHWTPDRFEHWLTESLTRLLLRARP